MDEPWTTLSLFALAVWNAMGFVAVIVLWVTHLADRSYRMRRNMPRGFVSLTLATIGTIAFVGAAWSSFLTVRRLLGLEVIEWSPVITVPLLILALSAPIVAAAVVVYQRYRY